MTEINRQLLPDEVSNARLPRDTWHLILEHIPYEIAYLPLHVSISGSKEREEEVANIKWTCRAIHHWIQAWQWKRIWISSIRELRVLLRRAELEPGALGLVQTFRMTPAWAWSCRYAHDWELCGEPSVWYFANRDTRKVEYHIKHMIPQTILDNYEVDKEFVDENAWEDDAIEGWDCGPDGEGSLPGLEDAGAVRDQLENLIIQMHALQVFNYGTQFIPLTEMMCRHLARAKDLQVVSIGPSGEFFTSTSSLSPLWLIFEGRERRPLQCLYLNVEVFPSSNEFKTAREHLQESVPEALEVLEDAFKDEKEPFQLPNMSRYLEYERSDDGVESQLSFVERPLAMVYRTLMTSRGKLRQLQTTEKALARVIDLLPLWAQIPFLAHDNRFRQTSWETDPYANALLSLQDRLIQLARKRSDSSGCPEEAEFLNMCESEDLSPLTSMIKGRRSLQEQMWALFLEGQRLHLPDWERPRTKSTGAFESSVAMSGETYVRGWPERVPDDQEWGALYYELEHGSEDEAGGGNE